MTDVEKAEILMRKGDFSQAKEILTQVLVEDPGDSRAICDIGIAFTETGENAKAIRTLSYYVQQDKTNPYAWEALGCARFRKGQYIQAQICLTRSLELLPENSSALRNLGVLYGFKGKTKEGLELLEKAYKKKADDFRTLYALAYAYTAGNDLKKAAEIWNLLLKLPSLPEEIRKDAEIKSLMSLLGWT